MIEVFKAFLKAKVQIIKFQEKCAEVREKKQDYLVPELKDDLADVLDPIKEQKDLPAFLKPFQDQFQAEAKKLNGVKEDQQIRDIDPKALSDNPFPILNNLVGMFSEAIAAFDKDEKFGAKFKELRILHEALLKIQQIKDLLNKHLTAPNDLAKLTAMVEQLKKATVDALARELIKIENSQAVCDDLKSYQNLINQVDTQFSTSATDLKDELNPVFDKTKEIHAAILLLKQQQEEELANAILLDKYSPSKVDQSSPAAGEEVELNGQETVPVQPTHQQPAKPTNGKLPNGHLNGKTNYPNGMNGVSKALSKLHHHGLNGTKAEAKQTVGVPINVKNNGSSKKNQDPLDNEFGHQLLFDFSYANGKSVQLPNASLVAKDPDDQTIYGRFATKALEIKTNSSEQKSPLATTDLHRSQPTKIVSPLLSNGPAFEIRKEQSGGITGGLVRSQSSLSNSLSSLRRQSAISSAGSNGAHSQNSSIKSGSTAIKDSTSHNSVTLYPR